jgi:peptide chain release factor 2
LKTPKILSNVSAKVWPQRVRVFDLPKRRLELKELEDQSNAPDLWNDPASAQQLMQKLSAAREFLAPLDSLQQRVSDAL